MAHEGPDIETEIKLRISGAPAARALLKKNGYALIRPRVFESNTLYDTPDHALRQRGELLRVRRAGDGAIVTFKVPQPLGRHKSRLELETQIGDAAVIETILEHVGLAVWFRYEKYRAEYQRGSEPGIVTIDETPIGEFLELEGAPEWIDATALELGFLEADYILASYGALYLEHCRRQNIEPGDMVFPR
jgi:adenylate cyclase class 2